ncbi:NAD-dependent protein deacetylase [Comamonas koreensis]|uniref:NAD-dependent protein deacetylase n=1 Tax=Comamonas koreensis TaxID=160825 RepID=A0AAW4XQU2_9BURK|nr:NAD-dependent protein deacetylase [Comamonas koreensis]MCD2163690.1 NAD-dependent protein deacetylase [Comamonas koreensis]
MPLLTDLLPQAPLSADLPALTRLLQQHRPWTVLTGAGVSTGSGIPDYRDAQGAWKRPAPVRFQDFMTETLTRQRYWARSLVGWPVFSQAQPNAAHQALARLEQAGYVQAIITQNVDGLHQRAGSQRVVDLHGRLDQVVCMGCGQRLARADFQHQLMAANPDWQHLSASAAPDGDADLAGVDFAAFQVPACPACGGILKPDVVFYGENVPAARRQQAMDYLAASGALLVVGSSLMVYSGLRFVHAAKQAGLPVAAINLGQMRDDALLDLKLAQACAPALSGLADLLAPGRTD